jgi:hypothetical protein
MFVEKWEKKWRKQVGINAHTLVKPQIAHRVAMMHGTTKERWEKAARAF